MVKKRQQYSAIFKAKVALEASRESGTLAQLSAKYHINGDHSKVRAKSFFSLRHLTKG